MSLLLLMAVAAARIPGQQFAEDQERRMMAEFAACVVKRRPDIAASVLLKGRYFPDNFLNPDCIPEVTSELSLSAQPILLRYALADALIRRERSLMLPDLSAIPPLKHDYVQTSYSDRDKSTAATNIAVSRYGECIVRMAPAESGRLLHSDVATPQEDSAFAALTAALSGCLFKGQTGTFSREVLRGTIALNFYRLAKAPRAASAKVAPE